MTISYHCIEVLVTAFDRKINLKGLKIIEKIKYNKVNSLHTQTEDMEENTLFTIATKKI